MAAVTRVITQETAMIRSLVASPLIALTLAACAPVLGPVVESEPGTSVPEESTDSAVRPTFKLRYIASINLPIPDCMKGVETVIIEVDTNGTDPADTGTHNDNVEQMLLTFSNGSTADTHSAAAFIEDGRTIRFMTSSVSNETLAVVTTVWLYDASGNILGTLEPTLEDPWVAWSCPDPP